jgi:hypothetical protein
MFLLFDQNDIQALRNADGNLRFDVRLQDVANVDLKICIFTGHEYRYYIKPVIACTLAHSQTISLAILLHEARFLTLGMIPLHNHGHAQILMLKPNRG